MIADRSLCLTADKERVVEHGDLEAAFLLVGPGSEVDPAAVQRFGLTFENGRVVYPGSPFQPAVEEKAAEVPEDKAAAVPEDKAAPAPKRSRRKSE